KQAHPYLAASLNNMGGVLSSLGEARKALPYHERALTMQRALIADRALFASEAEVLSFAAQLPLTRDGLLSASLNVGGSDRQAYAQVWRGKAQLTRLLQARHLAARASQDEKTQALWEQLRQARRDVARLLNTPGLDREERDKQLKKLDEAKEGLER